MEYSYLTSYKVKLLNDYLTYRPEHCALSYTNIPADLPTFDTNIKIYYFKEFSQPDLLELVYEHNAIKYSLVICRWHSSNYTLNDLKGELSVKNSKYHQMIIKRAAKLYIGKEDRKSDFFYLHGKLKSDVNLNRISNRSLKDRIVPDYNFNAFDEAELHRFTGKSSMDLISLNVNYDNIDFGQCFKSEHIDISGYTGFYYECDIIDFSGNSCNMFDYVKVHNFLYQSYRGSIKAGYDFPDYTSNRDIRDDYFYNNYLIIVTHSDKYMMIRYCSDDSSCDIIGIRITSQIYNSFPELWNDINDSEKALIVKAYL